MERIMSAIARWCFRHRFVVIAPWVVALTGLGALCQALKRNYDNSFSLPGTGSAIAQQLLSRAVPAQSGDSDTVVWQVADGTVRDPAVVGRMSAMLRNVATMPEVWPPCEPYTGPTAEKEAAC
jgi:putative drug exporter of the RND superfamily